MWKYYDLQQHKNFILALDLVPFLTDNEKKINLLYAISNNRKKYYVKKEILKSDGSKRTLLVPNKTLKIIQKNILNNILKALDVSKYATAYVKNKSLKDNVLMHVNRRIVLKLDIKNFFDNITFEHIYKVLPNYLFPPAIKVLLGKLCTYDDYLPQGAPTSPYLSNLVFKSFDEYMGKYCEDRNINYSRYCDDLTFSGDFDPDRIVRKVDAFLNEMGFILNPKKIKYLRNNSRQIITGLVVNKKINVSREYKRVIRQQMYYINKHGLDNVNIFLSQDISLLSLLGKVNYVLFINPCNNEFKTYKKIIEDMI